MDPPSRASPSLFWSLCSRRPDMDLLLLRGLPVLHGLPGRRALLPELQIRHQAASASPLPGEHPTWRRRGRCGRTPSSRGRRPREPWLSLKCRGQSTKQKARPQFSLRHEELGQVGWGVLAMPGPWHCERPGLAGAPEGWEWGRAGLEERTTQPGASTSRQAGWDPRASPCRAAEWWALGVPELSPVSTAASSTPWEHGPDLSIFFQEKSELQMIMRNLSIFK